MRKIMCFIFYLSFRRSVLIFFHESNTAAFIRFTTHKYNRAYCTDNVRILAQF